MKPPRDSAGGYHIVLQYSVARTGLPYWKVLNCWSEYLRKVRIRIPCHSKWGLKMRWLLTKKYFFDDFSFCSTVSLDQGCHQCLGIFNWIVLLLGIACLTCMYIFLVLLHVFYIFIIWLPFEQCELNSSLLNPLANGRFSDPYFKVLWEELKLNFHRGIRNKML